MIDKLLVNYDIYPSDEDSKRIFEKDIYDYYDAIDNIEKKAINEDIYSLIGENSLSKVIAENLEEKINRRIDIFKIRQVISYLP